MNANRLHLPSLPVHWGCALLLLGSPLAGCRSDSDAPELSVRDVRVWSVPPEGALQPAVRSVAVGNSGEVIALDTAARVLIYSPDGSVVRQWRMPESRVGKPEGICVLRDGRVVVCDTHYHRVITFNPDGTIARMFGAEGNGPGEFIYPVAVTKDAQENLYVAEYGSNDRIQKFTVEGRHLVTFGAFGTGRGEFQRPSGLVWRDGKIYAADAFNNRIQVFTDDGKFVDVLGSKEHPLDLRLPYDLKLGPDNVLYAVEYGGGRVTRLDFNGRVLGRFGAIGSGVGQFATPWGLAIDPEGRLYVADTGNRRVVKMDLELELEP